MNAKWILAAACAASLTTLNAQDEGTTRERIRQEVAEKQRLMREGKIVHSNVRVTIRLQNGSRIIGVVKNGRFVERHDGLSFIQSERFAKDSGLRLWYYDQTNSYIFLPWDSISESTIGEVLTDTEVAQMGIELDRISKETRPRGAATGAPAPAKGKSNAGEAGDAEKGAKPGDARSGANQGSSLTDEERALLTEFPPEEGWGEQRRQDLQLRQVQIHVYPNEHERRFLDNFEAWSAANDKRVAEEEAARANQPGATPPGGVVPPSSKTETGTKPSGGNPRNKSAPGTKAKGS